MKPATAKAKGAATEQAFVDYLKTWVTHAERRHLSGSADRGDIAGMPGWVWEVKSGGSIDLAGWEKELRAEVHNDGADNGAIVIRPKGKPDPHQWWAVMPLPWLIEVLMDAGWLPKETT